MKSLAIIPNGLLEIKQVYGNPDLNHDGTLDHWFVKNRLDIFELPYPMVLSWKPSVHVKYIQCHIDVGEIIIDAFTEILKHKGESYLESMGYNVYGGCFNFRPKRNNQGLSVHSWGVAIDINPHIAPYGKEGSQPGFIIDAFCKRGFEWGGTWKYKDPMHFQACRGY